MNEKKHEDRIGRGTKRKEKKRKYDVKEEVTKETSRGRVASKRRRERMRADQENEEKHRNTEKT